MILIDEKKCIGCELCLKKCSFGAIEMQNDIAVITDYCFHCGACVNACPFDAIMNDSANDKVIDFSKYRDVWVVLETDAEKGRLRKVSYELISEARLLADKLQQDVVGVLLGDQIPADIESLSHCGCDKVLVLQNQALSQYDTLLYTDVLTGLIARHNPDVVLFPATENGRDLAARAACRLNVGLTADCTSLAIDSDNQLVQVRPTYGGNIMASIISPNSRPQMASIRPNVLNIDNTNLREMEIVMVEHDIDRKNQGVLFLGYEEKRSIYRDVSDATVIVAGGYGMGGQENFVLLDQLALKMNAAIGASRKAVDEGWVPFEIQVGQTGKTVAPDLYIACGISGALQHTIGIKNAKKIISINSDPAAPIFAMSDVAIVGDVTSLLTNLIDKIEKRGKQALFEL